MNTCCKRLLAALLWLLLLPGAQAAITCTSITSPGVSINYDIFTIENVQTFFTVSCTRGSNTDPLSVTYSVAADDGLHVTTTGNRAQNASGAFVSYDVYTNASCSTRWSTTAATRINDTITWPAGATGTITRQTSFWGCITTRQFTLSSGAYTDTIGLRLTYNTQVITGTVGVTIFAPALCFVTTSGGTINVAYTAFGPARSGTTTFALNCTAGMPFTIATDVSEQVLTGLRYQLSLSDTHPNGTGAAQVFTVTATFPGGQAGDCPTGTCTASRTHTLTITY